ncbi:PD-(D/E)XK nuclease domain-containing protein [Candidatus Dependentiae bacterium]|nr:PD-(D/E)XK nuclease domain-containing protein [Candidatus Dependentiae bacterium]
MLIPYQINKLQEAYYHALFQLLITLIGFESIWEITTNRGRIDLTITTSSFISKIEIKLNTSSENALQQIEERGYYERFRFSGKNRHGRYSFQRK